MYYADGAASITYGLLQKVYIRTNKLLFLNITKNIKLIKMIRYTIQFIKFNTLGHGVLYVLFQTDGIHFALRNMETTRELRLQEQGACPADRHQNQTHLYIYILLQLQAGRQTAI